MVRARVLQEKISRLQVSSRGGMGMGTNDPRELLSRGVVRSDWLFYRGIENPKVVISISVTNVSYNVYTDLSNTHLSLQKRTSTQFFPRLVKDLMGRWKGLHKIRAENLGHVVFHPFSGAFLSLSWESPYMIRVRSLSRLSTLLVLIASVKQILDVQRFIN